MPIGWGCRRLLCLSATGTRLAWKPPGAGEGPPGVLSWLCASGEWQPSLLSSGGAWPGGLGGKGGTKGGERERGKEAPPPSFPPPRTRAPAMWWVTGRSGPRRRGGGSRGDRLIYRWEPPPARGRRRREGRTEPPRSPGAGREALARWGAQPPPPTGRDGSAGPWLALPRLGRLSPQGWRGLRGGTERLERRGIAEVRRAAPRSAPPRPGWVGLRRVPRRGPRSQPAEAQRSPLWRRCRRAAHSALVRNSNRGEDGASRGTRGAGWARSGGGKDGERPGCYAVPRLGTSQECCALRRRQPPRRAGAAGAGEPRCGAACTVSPLLGRAPQGVRTEGRPRSRCRAQGRAGSAPRALRSGPAVGGSRRRPRKLSAPVRPPALLPSRSAGAAGARSGAELAAACGGAVRKRHRQAPGRKRWLRAVGLSWPVRPPSVRRRSWG